MEKPEELKKLGHSKKSPLKALRENCLECCNGSSKEVSLCPVTVCPSYPFRHGKNPWRRKREVTPRQLAALKKTPSNDGQKLLDDRVGLELKPEVS